MFEENATEVGLPWSGPPAVRRVSVDVGGGQRVSALAWAETSPELVLLHGGGQNAHTWDTVALALERPLLAIDLPGHGHSDWRDDHDYSPVTSAPAVSAAIDIGRVKSSSRICPYCTPIKLSDRVLRAPLRLGSAASV